MLTRRDLLIRGGLLGLGAPALISACSTARKSTATSVSPTSPTARVATTGLAVPPPPTTPASGKTVRIATWPFYIENNDPATSATIRNFTAATGYAVDYQSSIDDNFTFTEKYVRDLSAGKPIGFDVVVPSSWMCATWIANGWVEEIPSSAVPNRNNLIDQMAHSDFDPDRKYTLPFTFGQVGIAYYPDKTGFPISSMKDFLRPELAGKTTILSDARDSVGMFLLLQGVKPETATREQMAAAVAEIKTYNGRGHFKAVEGNNYSDGLKSGETWAALAWSGDIADLQVDHPGLKWVLPSEGAMTFVDTMLIPKGANMDAAAAWMNYLYDPKVSGPLFEAISYGSPVKGAAEFMSPAASANPFIFPTAGADLHDLRSLSIAEAGSVNRAFASATA
jgi:spermidine/putrescine transport system substrate-binding protein